MTNLIVPEILALVAQAKTAQEKIQLLRIHKKPALVEILKWAYHPGPEYKFGLSEIPEYEPDQAPIGMTPSSLDVEFRRLYIFNSLEIPKINRQIPRRGKELLSRLLGSIHESEARVLVSVFQKSLDVEGLDENVVRFAFPGVLPPSPIVTQTETQTPVVDETVPVATDPVAEPVEVKPETPEGGADPVSEPISPVEVAPKKPIKQTKTKPASQPKPKKEPKPKKQKNEHTNETPSNP